MTLGVALNTAESRLQWALVGPGRLCREAMPGSQELNWTSRDAATEHNPLLESFTTSLDHFVTASID